jgi:hypothetical protein
MLTITGPAVLAIRRARARALRHQPYPDCRGRPGHRRQPGRLAARLAAAAARPSCSRTDRFGVTSYGRNPEAQG